MLYSILDKMSFWVTYHEMYSTCVEKRPELFTDLVNFLNRFFSGCKQLTGARHMRSSHCHSLRVVNNFLAKQKTLAMRPTLYA